MSVISAFVFVLLGMIAGGLGTLIGAGGGFVLTPLLLLLDPDAPPKEVTSISLAVVFFNAISGSLAYARMRRIDYRTGFTFAVATIPGAILGALATRALERGLFDILFGTLLVTIAVYIAVRRVVERPPSLEQRRGWRHRSLTDAYGRLYEYSFNINLGLVISFGVGFLSSLLGVGGGIIHVPAMVQLLSFPVHIATATSLFILLTTSLAGTLTHIWQQDLAGNVLRIMFIAIGVIAGAQGGARLANRLRGPVIIRLLAAALASVGIRLILLGAGVV